MRCGLCPQCLVVAPMRGSAIIAAAQLEWHWPTGEAPRMGRGSTLTHPLGSPRKGHFTSKQGSGGHSRDGCLFAQRRPPLGFSPWDWSQGAMPNSRRAIASSPLPMSSQGLLTLVVIATELYQNVILEDGQATPQHFLGLQESFETIGQKLGEFPASLKESRFIHPSQEGPGLDESLGGRERPPNGPTTHPGTQSDFCMSYSWRGTLGSRARWNSLTPDSVHDKMPVSLQRQEGRNLC